MMKHVITLHILSSIWNEIYFQISITGENVVNRRHCIRLVIRRFGAFYCITCHQYNLLKQWKLMQYFFRNCRFVKWRNVCWNAPYASKHTITLLASMALEYIGQSKTKMSNHVNFYAQVNSLRTLNNHLNDTRVNDLYRQLRKNPAIYLKSILLAVERFFIFTGQ